MDGEGGDEGTSLEFTPTWIVAGVCTVIVGISLIVERLLHFVGKYLKKNRKKPLFEALQKIKEELMLMGFMSLLLTVFQDVIVKICVKEGVMHHLLPCKYPSNTYNQGKLSSDATNTTGDHDHYYGNHEVDIHKASPGIGYCAEKGKVPLLSLEALHHLHIFIFVLAVVHVTFSVLTVVFGMAKMGSWKHWEDSIENDNYDTQEALQPKFTHVHQHDFIRERFQGISTHSVFLGWLHSFFKQFHASLTRSDYMALRLGFIMTHCRGNPKFNFHKYMIRALEDDFKKVVGVSWYLWVFVVIFLMLNINGWNTYFWISFIPFILLLALGTKLEHVITQLAHEVAEKHVAIEGELIVQPSDDHFWFHRPQVVLFLIHVILFQNAFDIAYFFWIRVQYGLYSCIMGQVHYTAPRLIIGVAVQLLCSCSTLPLYAIVTQMGSSFKKAAFDEHVQAGLLAWADKVKRRSRLKAANGSGHGSLPDRSSSSGIQLAETAH